MNSIDVKAKGIERSAQTDALLSAVGLDVLGALRTGIVCVLPDNTISAVNDAAADALGLLDARHIGSDFWAALPALHDGRGHDLIVATLNDGAPRSFHAALPGGPADATHEIRVARTNAGWLVFEVRESIQQQRDSSSEDGEQLREIARRMAAGSDSEALLSVLCDAARELAGADGAAVGRLAGSDGIVVASSGSEAPDAGTMFGVADSLAGNALRSRALIVEDEDPSLACPIFRGDAPVGEVAVAPLIAADQPVGLLCAWRRDDGSVFSQRDRQRLRTIADHAAVVLVKARLLEEARAASHAKGAFLAAISHELRTPLTALTGYGELLADEILGPLSAHQLDMVDRMRSVTHQLAVMVDELLMFSALEAGRESVHPSDVSIAEILDTVVAVIEPREWRLEDLAPAPGRPVLVLDAVQDPGNVGTIIRTAAALGATATVALPGTVDVWNSKVVRSAMGAHFHHPAFHASWQDVESFLARTSTSLWAADTGGEPLPGKAPARLALAVGNEGSGISAPVRAAASRVVSLPITATVESLNVAVATGIILHELRS